METFLVLTLISLLMIQTGAETCKWTMCPYPSGSFNFNPTIQFPFQLKPGQADRCGYPGFELSCNNKNQTIISMPSSGEFTVTSIGYTQQKLWVNDPGNCMPARFLADFSVDFPFQLDPRFGLRNFTFVNCTANATYPPYYLERFECLSGPNYTVGALLGYGPYNSSSFGCHVIKTVLVPSEWTRPSFSGHVSLTWNQPDCSSCRGTCGFKSRSGLEIACSDVPRYPHKGSSGLSKRGKYGIIIAAVLGFTLLSGLAFHFSGKVNNSEQQPNPDALIARSVPAAVVTVGLSSSTIESYPKYVFGESGFELLTNSNDDNVACPICLCEYETKEEVRMIPECKHYFHVNCIDEWLHKNATCPLCRQSATSPPSSVSRSSLPSSRVTQSHVETRSH